MRNASPLFLAVAVALPLSGCDITKDIPLTPEEIRKAASPFGMATRELIEDTSEGKVYRVMVESRRTATWADASHAMWEAERQVCPDGERHQHLTHEPAQRQTEEDVKREHPAGTLFVRTLRCAPKPPYEFEFERLLTADEAYGRMVRRLFDAAPDTTGEHVVQPILPSENLPKYWAIEQSYGTAVYQHLTRCASAVQVRHPQIGMFPANSVPAGQIAGFVGFIIECVDPAEAAAAATPGA